MATVETTERASGIPPVIKTRLQEVRRQEAWLQLRTGLLDASALFLSLWLAAMLFDWAFTPFSTALRTTLTLVALGATAVGLAVLVPPPIPAAAVMVEPEPMRSRMTATALQGSVTVVFDHPAAPATVIVKALGEQIGVRMRANGNLEKDILIVHVDGATQDQAMEWIAHVVEGEWIEQRGTLYLTRSAETERKQEEGGDDERPREAEKDLGIPLGNNLVETLMTHTLPREQPRRSYLLLRLIGGNIALVL